MLLQFPGQLNHVLPCARVGTTITSELFMYVGDDFAEQSHIASSYICLVQFHALSDFSMPVLEA